MLIDFEFSYEILKHMSLAMIMRATPRRNSVLGTGWLGMTGPTRWWLPCKNILQRNFSKIKKIKPQDQYCFRIGLILGMEITNNGILMTSDYQGRSSGEAYVQFSSKGDAEKALEKNKQSIGHRLVWLGMGPCYILGPGFA